jgi:hypothetical protein
VREILDLWTSFPRQIAAGLRAHYHGAYIRQWHSGEMSSRELSELIDNMPDESEYKRALAGYPFGVERDWSRMEYLTARQVAEIAASRGGVDYTGLSSPVEVAVETMKAANAWPPSWWPDEWKDDASPKPAEPGERVTAEQYEAVHGLMLDQLYGKG